MHPEGHDHHEKNKSHRFFVYFTHTDTRLFLMNYEGLSAAKPQPKTKVNHKSFFNHETSEIHEKNLAKT